MDTKQLEVFSAVSAAGSLSKAALEMAVTQPLVTRQIRALEEELGVELFYRNGRGVVLTEAGQLDRASEMLAEIARGDHPEALDPRRVRAPLRRIATARERLARARRRVAT